MKLTDFYYDLPPELIATTPSEPRDHARLMVVDRKTQTFEHAHFHDLAKWISADDFLILNNSKVIPARLLGKDFELLLMEETSPRHWLAIGKPGKRLKAGMRLHILSQKENMLPLECEVLEVLQDGQRVLRFFTDIDFDCYGLMPLPPYIEKMREQTHMTIQCPEDRQWYQTTYAASQGSVASPTAGLHFTPELLNQFQHSFVTLHVGLGTFRSIKTEFIEDHVMHYERYEIPDDLAAQVAPSKRIVAVGTTTVRVLETVPSLKAGKGKTNIFIHPPYTFKKVDALITNFHLPQSSLIVLLASFMGLELQKKAYQEAIREKYKFYSYGDAMLIL
jgi:S-adenosylmethionine:tRNA ribosyltransferase-isomerase